MALGLVVVAPVIGDYYEREEFPWPVVQEAAKLITKQHVRMFGLERTPHQHMGRLAGTNARRRRLNGRNACAILAHEGAR